jgi:hypothetical protein
MGADIILGSMFQVFGLNGVILISVLSLVFSLMWMYQIAQRRGLGTIGCFFLMIAAILASSLHWSARAHIFSYLAFVAVYYLSFFSRMKLELKTVLSFVLMFIWANTHGSVLLGIFMLALSVLDTWLSDAKRKITFSGTKICQDLLPLLAAIVAVSINERGPAFFLYVASYAQNIIGKSLEWIPFTIDMGIASWSFLFIITVLLALYIFGLYVPALWESLLLFTLCACSFYSMRFIPYFVLVALPAMGPPSKVIRDHLWNWSNNQRTYVEKKSITQITEKIVRALIQFDRLNENKLSFSPLRSISLTIVVGMLSMLFLVNPQLKQTDFYPGSLPVSAVNYLSHYPVTLIPHGFVYDNWGPYLNWRTNQRTFIDDKTDFYPRSFMQMYIATLLAQPGWLSNLDRYKLNYVLIPTNGCLDIALSKEHSWEKVYADQLSVL